MSIYSVIWHFFQFWQFLSLWRIQMTKYYHIRDQQVNFSQNRHLTCLVSKMLFLAAILIIFLIRGPPYWQKLPTDLANFQYQTAKDNFLPFLQFWRKSEQNCDLESTIEMKCKISAITSSISKFPNQWRHDDQLAFFSLGHSYGRNFAPIFFKIADKVESCLLLFKI